MQAITLEVILRAVVGVRDEQRADRLRAVLPGVLGVSLMLLFAEHTHPALFARLGRRLGWLRDREEAERLLDEEIAAHRADPEGRDDVLALLLAARDDEGRALSDVEVRDQLVTLLVAGHETTAATLAWALERLARHPAALARVRDAVRGGARTPTPS
jgi:cytochrome P450